MRKDPLNELFVDMPSFRKGQDAMMEEMAGDFDAGEQKGLETGLKHLKDIKNIATEWNNKKISAKDAMLKITKYVWKKVK